MRNETFLFRRAGQSNAILFIETDSFLEVVLRDVSAVIILYDLNLDVCWDRGNWTSEIQDGADEDMVPADGPVFQDETAVEIRDKEEETNEHGYTSHTEDGTRDGAI
jgi:hypothetical protein